MAEASNLPPPPLLNHYKYGLLRRRLLQTATGGLRLQTAPWFIHLIQTSVWLAPLIVYIPFIVMETIGVWNRYYLALVYACVMGGGCAGVRVIDIWIKHRERLSAARGSGHGREEGEGQAHFDDDEESVDLVFLRCFEVQTFRLVFGRRRLLVSLLHPVVSGVLAYGGCFVLFPGVLMETLHLAPVVVVFVLGWYSLCSAFFSLIGQPPQETAVYRGTDTLELRFLTRPSHVMAITTTFILTRLFVAHPQLYLQLLYAALSLLPLGWVFGLLPPLDSLAPWMAEQGLVRLLGGSATATDLRLLVMFTLSVVSVAVVGALPNRTLAVLLANVFGFLLSQDVFINLKAVGLSLFSKCPPASKTLTALCPRVFSKSFTSYSALDFHQISSPTVFMVALVSATVKGAVLLATSTVILYFTFEATGSSESVARKATGAVLIAVFTVLLVSDALQRVYVLGIFRNPLYPQQWEGVGKAKEKRKNLGYLSVPRRLAVAYVSPLLLVAYIGLSLESEHTVIPRVWFEVAAARVLRKVWQRTHSAHLELAVVAILDLALPADGCWAVLGLGSHAVIVGLSVDVATRLLTKLSFATVLWVSFITDKKQRTRTCLKVSLIVSSLVFLPLVLAAFLLSSLFATPLLPLFTLPLFLPAAPRVTRFWPSFADYGSSYAKCEDSLYYEEVEAEVARVLSHSISTGSIRVLPGSHLLLRFQDRLLFVSVLEVGFGYCTVNMRGLELQETSCHSVEATQVDDIFETTFNPKSSSCHRYWFNPHTISALHPVDSAVIHTYSDARTVLTGIIDQPAMLERFSGNLLKTLVWVLLHHLLHTSHSDTTGLTESLGQSGVAAMENHSHEVVTDLGLAESFPAERPRLHSHGDDILDTALPVGQKSTQLDGISWSDSILELRDTPEPLSPRRQAHHLYPDFQSGASLPGFVPGDRPLGSPSLRDAPSSQVTVTNGDDDDIILRQTDNPLSEAPTGLPPVDRGRPAGSSSAGQPCPCGVSLPQRWTKLPLQQSQLRRLASSFPQEWLQFVQNQPTLKQHSGAGGPASAGGQQLVDLVLACFSVVDVPTSQQRWCTDTRTSPHDLLRGFCGEFPNSSHGEWLADDEVLCGLVLKAYRYAVRLLYDEASLGECERLEELAEYLQHYDDECFIGCEREDGWRERVLAKTPSLFSLGRDPEKDVFTAHVLTLQEQVAHIASLNSEAVHGLWADLALELFYLTNDDEERYSIQAHSRLFRNLTVQAADPPLGYHIYSSGLVRVPCV